MPDTPTTPLVLTVPPAIAAAWDRLSPSDQHAYTQQFLALWMVGPPPYPPQPEPLTCFFCAEAHDLEDSIYGIPLCLTCRHMEHFQILLLQQLCFIQTSLYEMHAVMCGETVTLTPPPPQEPHPCLNQR